jgi:hypothetical protein
MHAIWRVDGRGDAWRSRRFPHAARSLNDYFFDGHGAPRGAHAAAKSSGDRARPLEGLDKWSTKMAATPSTTTAM